jgi:hypothetical protein
MNRSLGLLCMTAALAAIEVYGDYNNEGIDDKYITLAHMGTQQQYSAMAQKNQQQPMENMFQQGEALPDGEYPAAYNAPAAVRTKNWDCCTWTVSGSFIYWHASQESMDIAYVDPTAVIGFARKNAVAFQKFEYQPGFKIGLGLDSNFDDWSIAAEYTRLHETLHTHRTAPKVAGLQIYNNPDWYANTFSTNNTVPFAKSKWNLEFDMLDGVLSRPFYQGTRVTVSPYGGARVLWIEQEFNITLFGNNQVPSKSENQSESWGIGPKVGACTHWILGSGFRLEGNAAASLLYMRYDKVFHKESGLATTNTPSVQIHDVGGTIRHFSTLRPIIDMGMGIGWGYYLGSGQKCYIDLSARYDFMYLWNQNVMRELVTTLQNRVDHVGDLQIHGLTASAALSF